MSVTKTYSYNNAGTPGTVDVTVDITSCAIVSNPGGQTGTLSVTVTIPASLPFDLFIQFLKDLDYINSGSSGSQVIPSQLVLAAGNTTQTFTNLECFELVNEPFERNEFTWAFADQSGTQVIGSTLAASVLSQANASCFGQANGSIIIQTSGGSGGYQYLWSDSGANSASRNGLAAGTYSVIVRDSALNEVTISGIVITQPTQLNVSPAVTPATCFGGTNGAIALTPSGGTAPYSFSWSDGSSAQNRSALTAGTYTVTISDASGCSRAIPISVTQPSQIRITVNKEGKNITNLISGGVSPYSYLWSDGIITKDRINLVNGVYSFSVTDANGCVKTTVIVIQDFKFFFSKNPIWLQLAVDSMETKPNLSYVCEVYLEDQYLSESFNLKYSSEQPSRMDGTTDFNVQQVLNSFLDSAVPDFGDSAIQQVGEAFKRFYLRYFEKYGTPPVPDSTTTNDTFYVLFGGLSEQEFAKQTFFDSYLDTQKPFLTWQPMDQPIGSDQHAFLHFVVNNPTFSTLALRVTIRYTDNTSIETNLLSVIDAHPFEVYRFPAGPIQLGLQDINPSKIISSYDLQLVSGEELISEKRTYTLYATKRYFRKLIYLNSLGGWDHVLCFGRGKQSLRTQEEVISRELPVGYSYADREEETVSKMGMLTGQLVIATLNGYQRKHLIDLAISERVYEQTASGYLPVKVKFDFDTEDDFENLDEIGLDIIYPAIRRYTPTL